MDFKSRSSRPNSIDGFVGRPRPQINPGQTGSDAFSNFQRRSSIGFENQPPKTTHFLRSNSPAQPVQNQPVFSNYYSSSDKGSAEKKDVKAQPHHRHETKKKKSKWKKLVVRSGLVVLAFGIIIGGWLGWKIIGNIDNIFHGNIFSDAKALVSTTTLNGESSGRINILLLGDSADRTDATANGGKLTDSIMIASIDTKDQTAFMLSIPRDLWVNVPKEGYGKINSTYEYDGFGGVERLISADLGIPIDYYALVNYSAFEGLVNAVGGISVDIQSPDPRGLYDPQPYPGARAFKLTNGWHTLNGIQALDLARARGDAYGSYGFPQSDFNRTQHQRQMLLAIAAKGQSLGVVSNPLKVSQIFDTLGSNVTTNLTLSDVLKLVQLTKNIKLSSIQSLSYPYGGPNALLTNHTVAGGVSAIVPTAGIGNYSQMQAFYNQHTSNNPIAKEGATVVVLNGSDVIGLSHKEATVLENDGFNVSTVTDATAEYPDTMVIDLSNGKYPQSRNALTQILSSNTTFTSSTTTPAEAAEAHAYSNANFIVVLGKNWDGTSVN